MNEHMYIALGNKKPFSAPNLPKPISTKLHRPKASQCHICCGTDVDPPHPGDHVRHGTSNTSYLEPRILSTSVV